MNILSQRIIPIIGGISLFTAATALSQDYFRDFGNSRSSGGGRLAPGADVFIGNDPNGITPLTEADIQQAESQYNIRLGRLDLSVAAGVGIEFNDNITFSENDRISDFIFRPELDIQGAIRFSEKSRLRLGIGLSYAKYLEQSQFDSDSVLISPSSVVSWSAEVGAFKFTIRERLSYQEDPFAQTFLSGVARFKRWTNQAGVQVDWDASQYTKLSFGYDRYDLWSTDDTYEALDHGINTVFLRPSYQINPSVTVGINSSFSFVDFRLNTRADSTVLLVGPFIRWRASDYTDVYAEVGYQRSDFNGASLVRIVDFATGLQTGGIGFDSEDGSGFYAKLEISNRPSEKFRHKLAFSKTQEVGFQTNFFDLYRVEYTIDWAMLEKTSLRPSFFYDYYESSGVQPEEAQRFGAGLGIYHIFSDYFTLGLDYRYLVRDSNINQGDFYQNLVLLSAFYKF